jgi:hypothetical protein
MRWLVTSIALAAVWLAPSAASAEVVPLYNESFEDPVLTLEPEKEPKPPGWIWTGDFDVGTEFFRIEDPEAPDGDWVLQTDVNGEGAINGVHSPTTPVEPGGTYTVRMSIKAPLGRAVWIALSERGPNEEIQLPGGFREKLDPYIGTGQWGIIEHTVTFTEDAVGLRGYFRMGGAEDEPGTFYLDAVPAPEPEPEPEPQPDPQPAPGPGAGPPPPTQFRPYDPAPKVFQFGLTKRKFIATGGPGSKGTRFTYSLSERARVTITISRGKSGSSVILKANGKPGPQSIAFSGRGQRGPLAPGSYTARIVARDAAGQTSTPRSVSFQIVD